MMENFLGTKWRNICLKKALHISQNEANFFPLKIIDFMLLRYSSSGQSIINVDIEAIQEN